jgi:hypothetical protein
MPKLILRKKVDLQEIEEERHQRFKNLNPTDKMKELCRLIELTILLGGKNALKSPTGKGIVLKKQK